MIKGRLGTSRTPELKGSTHIHYDHFHPSSMLFQELADRLLHQVGQDIHLIFRWYRAILIIQICQ
ncbi:hypothetical protein [Caldibacillus debilis]|uniref:hypothetical protein n=1 Tax=Caldibacillus debilis TaxID=301148 RepID=UPI0023F0E547|nr:hypothetical protein [Caldibacillus debilis]